MAADRQKRVRIAAVVIAAAGLVLMGAGYLSGSSLWVAADQKGLFMVEDTPRSRVSYPEEGRISRVVGIQLHLDDFDVQIVHGEKLSVETVCYGSLRSPDVKVKDGILSIGETASQGRGVGTTLLDPRGQKRSQVRITLPYRRCSTVSCVLQKGDVLVDHLEADDLEIDTRQGDIQLHDISAQQAAIRLGRGNGSLLEVYVSEMDYQNERGQSTYQNATPQRGKTLNFASAGGPVKLQKLQVDIARLQLDGDLQASDVKAGQLYIRRTSGQVEISRLQDNGVISVIGGTGDVSLQGGSQQATVNIDSGDILLDVGRGKYACPTTAITQKGSITQQRQLAETYAVDCLAEDGKFTRAGKTVEGKNSFTTAAHYTRDDRSKMLLKTQKGDIALP